MRLERATYSQKLERDRLCFAEWGAKLALEQFLEREERLRNQAWARDGMSTWVWLSDSDEVLASCETFRMDSYLEGTLGNTYGVASVLVESRYRGRGYASEMLRSVISTLQNEDSQAHAVILFSEVGEGIYGRLGFVGKPMGEWVFEAQREWEAPRLAEPVSSGRLRTTWERTPLPEKAFFIWPSYEQIAWHLTRQEIYTSALEKIEPPHCGAIAGESILIWYADHKYDCLRALYFRARSTEDADSLIAAALAHARELGFREFRVWDSEEVTTPSLPFRRESLDDSIPMIRAYSSLLKAEAWDIVSRAMWI